MGVRGRGGGGTQSRAAAGGQLEGHTSIYSLLSDGAASAVLLGPPGGRGGKNAKRRPRASKACEHLLSRGAPLKAPPATRLGRGENEIRYLPKCTPRAT